MKTSKVVAMPNADTVSRPAELEKQIRPRAYQLYEERGKTDGYALDDWLLAEAEIKGHQVERKAS